jgi:pimeloyl-ACP methyl ester carboxylesterase
MATRMRDVVVVLPGITGSVLQHGGRDLWAVSGGAVWAALTSLGRSFDRLLLEDDDPDRDDLGDGITAPRMVEDVHLIPGLVKIDGYTRLLRMLRQEFELVEGRPGEEGPAGNFYPFPYDWRRDNRVAGRRLKALVDDALPRWRDRTGNPEAKVILIAHSMGGLVARHYLEVLEGWPECRALITFGTPFRGSTNAVGFLANGFRKALLDLSPLLRSFTSVHQLLPIYEMVQVDGAWRRVADSDLPNVDRRRAEAALRFHREIESAVEARRGTGGDYLLLPFHGTRQPTLQSARIVDGRVEVARTLPDWIDTGFSDGDGTVPRVSGTPIEMSSEYRETFVAERHSSLQNHGSVLTDVRERLRQMQAPGLAAVRGPEPAPDRARAPAIALDLEDLYAADEPVRIGATVVGDDRPGPLAVELAAVDGGVQPRTVELAPGEEATFEDVPPGTYRVAARSARSGPAGPDPVHDLLTVAP